MKKTSKPFRLLRVLKGKRGFTLIEVVLGMSISTILLVTLAAFTPPIAMNYVNTMELSYSRMMANNIADAVKNQLSVVNSVVLTGNSVTYVNEYGVNTISFTAVNPPIPGLSYDPHSYMTKDARVLVTGTPPNLAVTVTVATKASSNASIADYTLTREFRQLPT